MRLGEEHLGRLVGRIVIDGEGVEVAQLLIKPLLGRSKIANPREQLVEVVGPPVRVLEPFVVDHEPLDEILGQVPRRPLTKERPADSASAKADRENNRQGVKAHDVFFAVRGSC